MDQQPGRHRRPPAPPRRRGSWRWVALAAVGVVTVLVTSMLAVMADAKPPSQPRTPPTAGLLVSMTLEEKVGQVFMTYGYGASADDPAPAMVRRNRETHGVASIDQLVRTYHLGGVIYFTWSGNLGDPAQVARLSAGVQEAAAGSGAGIGALIATDQEHGVVTRLGPPVTQFPGSMALGATRSPSLAAAAAAITAEELRATGINVNLAPVADVNVNPANPVIGVRSFSSDPALVGRLVAAQVRAFQEHGVAAAAKHFPGHGDTDVDSHYGLPIITHTAAELDAVDLPPFREAIAAGADMIMTAHIVVPALDDPADTTPAGLPATINPAVLTGLLRERLGYDGVIITDALDMQGAKPYGDDSARRVPVEAFKAGADILLMPPDLDVAYRALLAAVRSGEIPVARLDASVTRILELKRARGILPPAPPDPGAVKRTVGTPEHRAQADRIAETAVTLVANDRGVLPLRRGARVLVAGASDGTAQPLAAALAERGIATRTLAAGTTPTDQQTAQAAAAARAVDTVVVTTSRATAEPSQRDLVAALTATGTPVVVVATREPYDLGLFPDAAAGLATYSPQPIAMRALARVLTGAVNPTGKLPVSVPAPDGTLRYRFGHGLSYPQPS